MRLTLTTKISYGWIRTGQDKAIETTGNRNQLNIIVALNLSDIRATVIHDYESINNESIFEQLFLTFHRINSDKKLIYQ